jgi:thiamine biosynthesis lipoprotein
VRQFLGPAILLCLVIGAVGCGSDLGSTGLVERTGSALGTTYSITIAAPHGIVDTGAIEIGVQDTLQRIDAQMSTYDSRSELSVFNASASTDWTPVSRDLCSALEDAQQIARMTDGAFDITVGRLVNLWGFGPTGSRAEPPADDEIAAARTHSGYEKLETDCASLRFRKMDPSLYLDLSAYAKGLAVDRIAEFLNDANVAHYLVEIGGELRARGRKNASQKWRIAIEKPLVLERSVQRVIELSDQSMATSGDYRNFFEADGKRYSHTIDPRSGRPVDHTLASVTVIGGDAATADALATALLVMGPEEGPAFAVRHGISALFLVHGPQGIAERVTMDFGNASATESPGDRSSQ